MSNRDEEGSNIAYPWDEKASSGIQCPNCGNDGMDGSIDGQMRQFGIKRKCLKCGHSWDGGLGVQRADFSSPPVIPGVASPVETPSPSFTGAPYRDPNKNYED